MNSFGSRFRISIFGESHAQAVGVVMDGVPAGIAMGEDFFKSALERRRGSMVGTTPRRERDQPEIVSGVFDGHTTGAPLTVMFRNEDVRTEDYSNLIAHPRPSHADFVAQQKYKGYNDYRGGGHFSGRLTLGLVVAGEVAKKMIGSGIDIKAWVVEVGAEKESELFGKVVERAMDSGDSVGGVIECVAKGVPVGWGEPFFDSFESVLSHLLFSIPAIKGVAFGSGFEAARMSGSQHNDPIINERGETATNHSGGINGGISNGNPIVVRVAVKPTPSIAREQLTFNYEHMQVRPLKIEGRHDACIALRMPVIIEAAMAITLAQFVGL